jgi:DNA-binding transcriptional LysR family regulator
MKQLYLKDHLEKLYPFKIIADLGGLTAAAKVLNLSQSSLSHTMKTLEEILETALLVRHARGITLTAEGEALYDFSKRIFHQADNVELKIKNFSKEHFGILKIATHETLATHVWPEFIQSISKIFPKLQVSLLSGRIDPIINDVLNANVDLALTVEPLNNSKLTCIPIYSGDFGFYTSFKDKRASVSISDLDDVPILTDSHAHFKQGMPIPQYLALAGLKLKQSFSLNSFEAAINLAATGTGMCIIPRKNAQRAVSEMKIKEIKVRDLKVKPFGSYTICASYLKSSQNKMIAPFVDELLNHLKGRS